MSDNVLEALNILASETAHLAEVLKGSAQSLEHSANILADVAGVMPECDWYESVVASYSFYPELASAAKMVQGLLKNMHVLAAALSKIKCDIAVEREKIRGRGEKGDD